MKKFVILILLVIFGLSYASRIDVELGASDTLAVWGGPAIAYLDSVPIVLVGTTDDSIYAISYDGSMLPGFPFYVHGPITSKLAWENVDSMLAVFALTANGILWRIDYDGVVAESIYALKLGNQAHFVSPVLYDLNGDGELEVIVCVDTNLFALTFDGVQIFHVAFSSTTGSCVSSPTLADIDGDGEAEIILESYRKLFAYEPTGSLLSGFPVEMPEHCYLSYSTPLGWDYDCDGIDELFFGAHVSGYGAEHGLVMRYDHSSSSLDTLYVVGHPGSWVYCSPAVGDVGGDYRYDLAFNSVDGTVFALTPEGALSSFGGVALHLAFGHTYGTPLLADINFEIGPEYIIQAFNEDSSRQFLVAMNPLSSYVDSFPDTVEHARSGVLTPALFTFHDTTFIVSIDGGGRLSIWSVDRVPVPGYRFWCQFLGDRRNSNTMLPPQLELFVKKISDTTYEIYWNRPDWRFASAYQLYRSTDSVGLFSEPIVRITDLDDTSFVYTSSAPPGSLWFFVLLEDSFGRTGLKSVPKSPSREVVSEHRFTDAERFEIRQNPFNSILFIRAEDAYYASVFDVTGRIVRKVYFQKNGLVSINLNGFPSGIYLIRVMFRSGCMSPIKKAILVK